MNDVFQKPKEWEDNQNLRQDDIDISNAGSLSERKVSISSLKFRKFPHNFGFSNVRWIESSGTNNCYSTTKITNKFLFRILFL